MKRVVTVAACLMLLVGCKEVTTSAPALADDGKALIASGGVSLEDLGSVVSNEYLGLYGMWSGYIERPTERVMMIEILEPVDETADDTALKPPQKIVDKISVSIKNIEDGLVLGYTNVAGKKLALRGTLRAEDGKQLIKLSNKTGRRENNIFNLEVNSDGSITGTYKVKPESDEKKVALSRQVFTYDANVMPSRSDAIDWQSSKNITKTYTEKDGEKFNYTRESFRHTSDKVPVINASVEKLTEARLKNLMKIDLEIIRNTIYARHGYTFKRTYLRSLFNASDWYIPVSDNVEKDLTELERENIILLKRMEKYATDHYEHFGR